MGEYSCDYLSHFCAGSKVVNMAGAGTSAYQWGDGAANTTLADTPANALAAAAVYLNDRRVRAILATIVVPRPGNMFEARSLERKLL